ncbi:CASP-like protein 1B2 [Glycine soja]|uniref:CASP-like protein n=1 Tax=Glycine soja TaxID=3848 RepID=A0A445IYJ7_GLYSO|nr:CASP-like protein 1B2 [Glycine soja]
MAFNKQTKSFVVATVGSTPITATFAAKFNQTPAFVFFVIANGNAALHNNLVMIAMEILGTRYDYKGPRLALIAILDMLFHGHLRHPKLVFSIMCPISAVTCCCSLTIDIMNGDPKNMQPLYLHPPNTKSEESP